MSEEEKPEFDLNKHTARLLMNEPFFAGLSRRVDKRKTTDIPTAGVTVDPKTAQFVLLYNPDYFATLSDKEKLGVLKHEFYHLTFEHVTGRKPEGGLTREDNMCMDLAINSHLIGELPDKCCIPGEKPFEWAEPGKSYEWYKANWQPMDNSEGEGGSRRPGCFHDSDRLHPAALPSWRTEQRFGRPFRTTGHTLDGPCLHIAVFCLPRACSGGTAHAHGCWKFFRSVWPTPAIG